MKKRILIFLMALSMLLCSACGVRTEIKFKADKSYTQKNYYCLSKSELKDFELSAKDADKKVTVNGKTYYAFSDAGMDDVGMDEESEIDDVFKDMYLTSSKAEFPFSTIGSSKEDIESADLVSSTMDFYQYKFTFPKKILKTNGKITNNGYSVIFDLTKVVTDWKKGSRVYVAFTNTAVNSTKITIDGITNGKTYSTTRTVKVSSPGVIKSLTLNGRQTHGNTFKVKKSGNYTVTVKLLSGKTKTVKFTIKK